MVRLINTFCVDVDCLKIRKKWKFGFEMGIKILNYPKYSTQIRYLNANYLGGTAKPPKCTEVTVT